MSEIERMDALNDARNRELPSPGQFNVPKNGSADNYHQDSAADDYSQDAGGGSHSDRLAAARKGGIRETAKVAKDLAELATPVGALSLLKQINPIGDLPYVAAMGAAMLKDLLDFVTFETVILPMLFAALCSIFIFMMMLITSSGGNKKIAKTILKKIALLLGGGVADSIPGINFFPIEMITVAIIYVLTLIERKNSKQ